MEEKIGENELMILQSILLKLVAHFANIEDILALNHFLDILDMLHGSSRNSVNMQLLSMATRVTFKILQSLRSYLKSLRPCMMV